MEISRLQGMKSSRSVIRMSDVAGELGLSRVTVSAVLNDRYRKAGISDDTAAKVKAAAREMGYFRNDLAMAMKSGKNQVIGAIVSNLANGWVGRILSGILQGTQESEYLIKLEEVSGREAEEAALSRLIGQRVAGVLCCNLHPEKPFIESLAKAAEGYSMPVVSVASNLDLPGTRIASDDFAGSSNAVEFLWELGHRRIGYISGQEPFAWVRDRTVGFLDAFKKLGGEVCEDTVSLAPFDAKEFESLIFRILTKKRDRPTALLCINDQSAAICLRVARSLGIDVPGGLSVIGYESGIAEYTDPPLTTLEQPFQEMGRRCVEEMLACISNGRGRGSSDGEARILLPLSFHERGSTGPLESR